MKGGASPAHSRASANPDEGSAVVADADRSPLSRGRADHAVIVAGTTLLADPAGALYWPDERLLIVADLHLEKGSAFAKRGVLLPPYDTATTLARLARLIERYAPRLLIALGDSFHDGHGPSRMSGGDRAALKMLQRGGDWIWIAGNHDPDLPDGIGGGFAEVLALGPLTFRHEPSPDASPAHSRASANPDEGSAVVADADRSPLSRGRADHAVIVAGTTLLADPAGALYWPDERLLIVADLHLEKGSAFAKRGVLLPPYDTATTLARLARLIERYAPRLLIALGDSFHDGHGPSRMSGGDRAALKMLQRGGDWIWIAGNHDPDLPDGIGGGFAEVLALGPLTFRHEPSPDACDGEIAGHLHPLARVAQRGRAVRRRCFASDGRRLVMPAFGAYAGGLNVRDRAIFGLFGTLSFTAHMLGARRLFAIAAERCLPD